MTIISSMEMTAESIFLMTMEILTHSQFCPFHSLLVDYDLEKPYNVYGGMQDNGVWFGHQAIDLTIKRKNLIMATTSNFY